MILCKVRTKETEMEVVINAQTTDSASMSLARHSFCFSAVRILLLLLVCSMEPILRAADVSVPILAPSGHDAVIVLPQEQSSIIRYAVSDFNDDCIEVSGRKLRLETSPAISTATIILPAVVGKSPLLDRLEKEKKINLDKIRGKWESYLIQPISHPFPGVASALVIAGGDERGVMYGLYEVGERVFGTDPQKYWTDFVPKRADNASWNFGVVFQGPPTFKFRGWFVNDEHGLLGWRHVAGEPNRIEPEIWARIFETICRMRGNVYTLIDYGATPDAGSLKLANDRGLYITGAHDQTLISNSLYEWNKYSEEKYGSVLPYHWTTHSKEIVSFWTDEGVMRHRKDLAIWTLGLRGQGDIDFYEGDPDAPKSMADRARITNEAVQLEENIVRKNLPPGSKPLFMAALRGGLLEQYKTGLIHWPKETMILREDDASFGILREVPSKEEFERYPNHGIYFRLTYCDNHWVQWVPMRQVQDQMLKAVRAGAVSMVQFNVGDIRELPMKIAMAMDLTWNAQPWLDDPNHWRPFTENWISREYSPHDPKEIADLFVRYWNMEMPVRSMIILEEISRYTILDKSLLKAVMNSTDKKAAFLSAAQNFKPPTGDRFGNLTLAYIKQNEPNWESLWKDAQASQDGIADDRKQFYEDSFLLQIQTSRLMNIWGLQIFEAFEAIKVSDFSSAADHLEAAAQAIHELRLQRAKAEHGKWQGWFNGDYNLDSWKNSYWAFHGEREESADLELAKLLRSL